MLNKIFCFSLLILSASSIALSDQKLFLPHFYVEKSDQQIEFEKQAGKKHFGGSLETASPKADLLKFMTPVKDQGSRGTCAAFASVALLEAQLKKLVGGEPDLSEQYLYWESKAIDRISPISDGSFVLRLLKSIDSGIPHGGHMALRGVPDERLWHYEQDGWFDDKVNHPDCYRSFRLNPERVPTDCLTNGRPPLEAVHAPKITVEQSQNIPSSPEAIIGYINLGIPVIVTLDFFTKAWGFNNYRTLAYRKGIVNYPQKGDRHEGGHAVLLVGYDTQTETYLFKNSWGTTDWSKESPFPGFGSIPFAYIQKYAIATVAKIKLPAP